jgi:PhzF family phenazine biosynthesis protein
MPSLKLYQIDAFARHVFAGNPAAVCPLEAWLDDATLQAIAQEINLSETAFFAPEGNDLRLRWFTPVKEVRLCGHGTLASAFVIFTELDPTLEMVRFETLSGRLWVRRDGERRDGERLVMDFPSRRLEGCDPPGEMLQSLNIAPQQVLEVTGGRTLVAVYADEQEVRSVRPDFAIMARLGRAVGITAPGDSSDCASRYFAPHAGVPEDPVTGSLHCALVPYWAARLGKREIYAKQVSRRGGELFCEACGDRVQIAGYAVKFMEGLVQV